MKTQSLQLAEAIGEDIKDLQQSQGDLTTLETISDTSLVDAINEVNEMLKNKVGFKEIIS